jgi:hypothetical protein
MKKALVKLRSPNSDHTSGGWEQTAYRFAAPFFENPRGVLIHRVRALYELKPPYDREPWSIVEYWCGNHGRDCNDSGLLFDPGVKLICARCEAMAVAKGEKTSSQLAGRHVCTGICVPVNTCCPNQTN